MKHQRSMRLIAGLLAGAAVIACVGAQPGHGREPTAIGGLLERKLGGETAGQRGAEVEPFNKDGTPFAVGVTNLEVVRSGACGHVQGLQRIDRRS